MTPADIIRIGKGGDWWKEERKPSAHADIVKARPVGKLLTVKQVATRMACGIWLVYDLIRERQLECQPVGKRGKRVPEASVDAYLERRRHEERARRGA